MISNNIIQGFPIPQKDYYKVYVRSITYNQAPYIEDCMNGVAMQKTDFPFVHHVIDDCSTDGEQEVIKAWIERECDINNAEFYDNDICTITLAKHKSNMSYTIVAYFLKRNMYRERAKKEKLYTLWREICPYEAICEGDDYWIDAEKLKKEVEYLDEHKEKDLVFTDCNWYYQNTNIMQEYVFKNKIHTYCSNFEIMLLRGGFIAPLTWVFRRGAIMRSCEYNFRDTSFCVALELFAQNGIGFIEDCTAVYRNVSESASHSKDYRKKYEYDKDVFACQKFYQKKYPGLVDKTKFEDMLIKKYNRFITRAIICKDNEMINEIRNYHPLKKNLKIQLLLAFPILVELKLILQGLKKNG